MPNEPRPTSPEPHGLTSEEIEAEVKASHGKLCLGIISRKGDDCHTEAVLRNLAERIASAAAQAERERIAGRLDIVQKVLIGCEWAGLYGRRCYICAGWDVGPNGETDKVHTKDCAYPKALQAIAAIRQSAPGGEGKS